MKLGVKHQDQKPIVRADFSGGLNTTANMDGIAENQLSAAVNVEIDHATGRLKTVAGTADVLRFNNIFAAAYDEINKKLLIATNDKRVFAVELNSRRVSGVLGTLSGDLYPISTSWEDGLLLASGGKLQYYNGTTLVTIADSPIATSVYVRAGRILVTSTDTVYFSGVGDETNWTEDTNDDSSSKFLEVGYKDGGKIVGMINLSSDVLFVKDNRRLYRLSGEFPEWSVSEVSRNIEVSGRMSICSVADSVFILGRNELQNVQTTNAYGDMKPQNVATLIAQEIQSLPDNATLRHMPALQQVWAISGQIVLVLDLVTQSWYKRKFNSNVIDAISIGDEVLIIKSDRVSRLDDASFYDAGVTLRWRWQGQRMISQHEYLLKRAQVLFVPINVGEISGEIDVGGVVIPLPPKRINASRQRYLSPPDERIYNNREPIYDNPRPIFSRTTVLAESKNVYRNKFLDIGGFGATGGIIFNSIILDVAEV